VAYFLGAHSFVSAHIVAAPTMLAGCSAMQCCSARRRGFAQARECGCYMSVVVDVCVCTYRRASLVDTLRSIGRQRLPPGMSVRVIVADNDEAPSAREMVQRARSELSLDCLYIHAPARNIAIACNACLDAANAPLIAFIDDDEIATECWLTKLVASQRLSGVTVIFGPVRAIYTVGPAWLQKADLYSNRPVIRKNGWIATGYTGNVLISREALREALRTCRFDPELGRSGGEDTTFFHGLYNLGARFCSDGFVNELVLPHRARLSWLLKRSFRSGQTHGRILMGQGGRRPAVAAAKLGYSLISACLRAASPSASRRYLVRGALHAGVVANSIGLRHLQLY
jgi:succinoglycan biosynthesis protein ExoM